MNGIEQGESGSIRGNCNKLYLRPVDDDDEFLGAEKWSREPKFWETFFADKTRVCRICERERGRRGEGEGERGVRERRRFKLQRIGINSETLLRIQFRPVAFDLLRRHRIVLLVENIKKRFRGYGCYEERRSSNQILEGADRNRWVRRSILKRWQ